MKKTYQQLLAISALLLALTVMIATALSSLAWLSDKRSQAPNLTSSVQGSYFESGDGLPETRDEEGNIIHSPFEIKYPMQLYYFAWLQALGVFNHEEEDNVGTLQQYYFRLSDDLDMTGIELPPIGTQTFPFVGNFDGENHKISNLTVTNKNSDFYGRPTYDSSIETEVANGAQIIGFFGVIGTTGTQVDDTVNGEGTVTAKGSVTIGRTTYTYSSTVNEVKNFLLDTVTVKTETPASNKTLIGIAAGYVNGKMSGVGVYNGSIEVASGLSVLDSDNITDKISCYSLVGYSKVAVDAYVAKEGPTGNEWGGSVGMTDAHTRLTAAYSSSTTPSYVYRKYRNLFYDINGNQVGDPVQTNSSPTTVFHYKDYDSSGGSYLFTNYKGTGTTKTSVYYLNAGVHLVDTKYYFADTTGYTFSDAGATYYLQGTTEGNITHSTESGTVWLQNGNTYYIETVSGQATSSTKYYLGADAYGRVTCTTTSTNWTLNGSSLYTGSQYLVHVNGANGGWGLTDNRAIIQISNGTNYLGSSGTSAVTAGNAAEWLNTNGYLHTVVNNTHYYLNRSDTTVSITTTPSTQWSVSSSGITDGSYSLVCDGGTWKAEKTGIYITDGTNYLSIVNNNAIGNRTSTSNATVWMLAANGTGYRIYATVGNTTYYLRNNGGTLTLYSGNTENNRTTWTMDSNTLSSGNYYLGYNGGWTLQQDSGEFYLYDGTRYLYYNNSSTPAATNTRASATTWIQNGNYFSPASRTTYYLNNTRSGNWNYTYTPNISNSTDYRYQLDNSNRLYFSGNNFWSTTSYYLYYSSGWKTTTTAGSASTFQKISAFEAPVLQFVSAGTPLSNEDQSFAGIARTSAAAKYYTSETLPDYVDYTQGYATYLPLNTDPEDSTLARNSNTGYIVGGSYDPTTTSTYPDRAGDIRISYYSISGNINNSYSDGVLKTDEIYTINGTGEHPIANIGTEKFKKYSASSSDFLSILAKDNTYVYGLHFMNAQISKNQLIKASKVTINGDSYTNYEMPAASIDFNLAHKGYINFFAGTYFTGNNSFFSLHRIFRDNSHNITDIKEIEEIWGVDGDENLFYAYVYSGETGETIALSDGSRTFDNISALLEYDSRYTCLFETEWIKTNALKQNYIYYFEIPADSGEYALGSVDGGTGAYLLYLDISANSGDVDRSVMDYLKGVDFVTSNDPETAEALLTAIADNNPTAAFALKDAFSGNVSKVTFTRTEAGDTITITVTGNADPSDYMRKYYIPLDDKTIEINFVASS